MQAVRSVASGGKFYRLPPDKENTVNGKATILENTCVRFPLLISVLQSSQCSKIRVAQYWGRRGAHLSENKGMKSECKKFEENSRETGSVTSIVVTFE